MTPSPDTGAGTPLDDPEHPLTAEEADRAIEIWRRHWPHLDWGAAVAVNLADRLDAARSRPATDPAGLDVERLARLVVSYADLTHAVVVEGRDWREIADEWGQVVEECRGYLARLPVADRPGPDRWTDLEAAWAEVASALPTERATMLRLTWRIGMNEKFPPDEDFEARAEWWSGDDRQVESKYADTPAGALRSLAAALSRPLPENREEPSR